MWRPALSRALAALAALALIALYAAALGTATGRRLDAVLIDTDVGTGPIVAALQRLLAPITSLTVGAASAALVVWAALRRDRACTVRIATALGGTFISLLVLDRVFRHVDPFGGEALRRLGRDSYPSGHAAAVAAIALAAVALSPRRGRLAAGALACVLVATTGIALVVTHAHYPSDVLGGWLLALLWSAGAVRSHRAA